MSLDLSLVPLDYTLVPTRGGHNLDGHFPDGNDGTGNIPLVWATVPSFTQKQVGTPFSVDLFGLYLTQLGGAVASIYTGALSGGWTLSSAGVLSYDGLGQGVGTITVEAFITGKTPAISNSFSFESIATIGSSDTLPPTIPTSFKVTGSTPSGGSNHGSISVTNDCPSDVPTATIPSSGYKETRYLINSLLDGANTSSQVGVQARASKVDISASGGSRLFPAGHWVALSFSQRNVAGGIPGSFLFGTASWTGVTTTITMSAVTTGPPVNGMVIKGPGIPAGTTLSSFSGTSPNYTLHLSQSTTGTQTGVAISGAALTDAGPICGTITDNSSPGPVAILVPIQWSDMESGTNGGVYTTTAGFQRIANEYRQAAAAGVYYVIKFVTRTFNGTGNLTTHPNGDTLDGNNEQLNPMPGYLLAKAAPFTSPSPGGWQGYRWDSTVVTRFNLLMQALAAFKIDGVALADCPFFGGVATQETSTSSSGTTANGYSPATFISALNSEQSAIASAFPKQRGWCYENFIQGDTNSGSQADLQTLAQDIQPVGAGFGGPDLVLASGRITQYCYVNYTYYHTGTGGVPGAGITFCSVQNEECTNTGPAQRTPAATAQNLYDYANGLIADDRGNKPLRLDIIVWDWHTSTTDPICWNHAGSTGGPSIVSIIKNNPPPFGTFVNPGGITPGTVVQSGVKYTVTGYGAGIGASSDEWSAASVPMNGDFMVACQLTSLTGTDVSAAIAGIAIREQPAAGANAANSRVVDIVCTPTQIRCRYRGTVSGAMTDVLNLSGAGNNNQSAPWLKIQRLLGTFYFYVSPTADGLATLDASQALSMGQNTTVEFFSSSGGKATPAVAVFDQCNIQNLPSPTHTYANLVAGTYQVQAHGRDLALNDSADCPAITVVIG